jgi:ABC-type microcin C transport system permease subunit YejB
MIMFRIHKPRLRTFDHVSSRLFSTTRILAVYFGITGLLYLIAVPYGVFRLVNTGGRFDAYNIAAIVAGCFVTFSWIYASKLIFNRNRNGVYWGLAPLAIISAQWFGSVTPTINQFLTVVAGFIACGFSWFELRQEGTKAPKDQVITS